MRHGERTPAHAFKVKPIADGTHRHGAEGACFPPPAKVAAAWSAQYRAGARTVVRPRVRAAAARVPARIAMW